MWGVVVSDEVPRDVRGVDEHGVDCMWGVVVSDEVPRDVRGVDEHGVDCMWGVVVSDEVPHEVQGVDEHGVDCMWGVVVSDEVPREVRGVDEHGVDPGADPLQQADGRGSTQPAGHAQGHQGTDRHVVRTGGRRRQHDGRQGTHPTQEGRKWFI